MAQPLRAAVVGLGRVGSRFDEEAGRDVVWSHVGAYLSAPDAFTLAAAVEPSSRSRARAQTTS